MTKQRRTETEKKELLEFLVDDNPAMQDFLRRQRVRDIPHIDEKCAILFLEGDDVHSYKYVIDPNGRSEKILSPQLSEVMRRGLRCQKMSESILGVQPVPSPTFYEGVTGLVQLTYLHGHNLSHSYEVEQLREPTEVIRLYSELASTLEGIHTIGVIHRDVKPGNLILSNNRLWLIDWSIAATPDADKADRGAGLYLGTPKYMYFFGDRSRDFYAAGLSLLHTLVPELAVPAQIRLDTDAIVRVLTQEIRRRHHSEAAELFDNFMHRPSEYHVPLELRNDPLIGWRDSNAANQTITGYSTNPREADISTVDLYPRLRVVPEDASRSLTTH